MMRIWLSLPRQQGRGALLALVALTLLGGAGCGDKRATVSGTVTGPDGKPVTMGTVSFIDVNHKNRIGTGNIDDKGQYTATNAPVGEVKVTVSVPKRPMMMKGQLKMPPGKKIQPPEGLEPSGTAPMNMDPSRIPFIPEPIRAKYSNPDSSPLKFKVEEGSQEFPIKLMP